MDEDPAKRSVKKVHEKRVVAIQTAGRRRIVELAAISAVLAVLLLVTAGTAIGAEESLLDYNLVWVALVAILIIFWRKAMKSRSFVAAHLIYWAVMATFAGFFLLYAKQWLKDIGYKDYVKFWHCTASGLFAMFAIWHATIHWDTIKGFFAIQLKRASSALRYAAVWIAIAIGVLVTLTEQGKTWINNDNYIPVCTATIFAVAAAFILLYKLSEIRCKKTGKQFKSEMSRLLVVNIIPITLFKAIGG
ncbi:MAG: hypothetical protein PHH26_06765, partial [Candidatus Thermoplasmatota archaeon]|nr:hypothetical protein [Candidatus Thermoplasmatota archaeon]